MAKYGRHRPSLQARPDNSHWLCFSDLMSALLLVFVLVLFYAIYQYTDTTFQLVMQQGLLDEQKGVLDDKDKQIEQASSDLTKSQEQLLTEKARIILQDNQLKEAQDLLKSREDELTAALAQLDQQQAQLATHQLQLQDQETLLTTQQDQMTLQQQQLEALVGVRARIVSDLAQALSNAHITANVDSSGAIRIDESVLFDFASSELKESGKAMLDRFIPIYMNVLFSAENEDSVSQILLEGHTDDVGSYLSNLTLSQQRTLSVVDYIMSPENTSINPEVKEKLVEKMTASGRSFSDPITDANGNVDSNASRRVEFKFMMHDEQMIENMRQILSSMSAEVAADPTQTPESAATPSPEAPASDDQPAQPDAENGG